MIRYLARREPEAKAARRRLSLSAALLAGALFCSSARAEEGAPPAPAVPDGGAPLCQLIKLAHTALRATDHSMLLMNELEKAVDDRLDESRSAFKACEQDESCRTSPRLRDLEEAFNQAHAQKQRLASSHAEAVQRKAELETRYKTLKDQATEAGCPALDAPGAAQ